MKTFLLTALAAALVVPTMAAPALAQNNNSKNHANMHSNDHGKQASRASNQHQFKRGGKFDRKYATNYREVNYRSYKQLKAPPRGYHWVRSGNDALLVAQNNNVIASIMAGMFR